MITYVRTWVAQAGKLFDLVAMLKELAAVSKRATGIDAVVATTIGGNFAEVSLIWQIESVTANDEGFAKILAEPGFSELVAKLGTVAVSGASHEHLYRHM